MDVTADAYPYLAWHSNLKVLVPNKQWTDPTSVKKALDDVGGGRNVQITRPRGIHAVFVNGIPVLGADRGASPLPGRVLAKGTR